MNEEHANDISILISHDDDITYNILHIKIMTNLLGFLFLGEHDLIVESLVFLRNHHLSQSFLFCFLSLSELALIDHLSLTSAYR